MQVSAVKRGQLMEFYGLDDPSLQPQTWTEPAKPLLSSAAAAIMGALPNTATATTTTTTTAINTAINTTSSNTSNAAGSEQPAMEVEDVLKQQAGLSCTLTTPQTLLTSRFFDPKSYISHLATTTPAADGSDKLTFRQLEQALAVLQREVEEREHVLKSLAKQHFDRFIASKSSVDAIYLDLKRRIHPATTLQLSPDGLVIDTQLTQNTSSSQSQQQEVGDAALEGLKTALVALNQHAKSLFTPILDRRSQSLLLRSTLAWLERFRFFFDLPATLKGWVHKAQWDHFVRDYKKGRALIAQFQQQQQHRKPTTTTTTNTPFNTSINSVDAGMPEWTIAEKVLKQVWADVEKWTVVVRRRLFALLQDWTMVGTEQHERYIVYLMELDAYSSSTTSTMTVTATIPEKTVGEGAGGGVEEDPVWFVVKGLYDWMLKLMRKAYKDYLVQLESLADEFHEHRHHHDNTASTAQQRAASPSLQHKPATTKRKYNTLNITSTHFRKSVEAARSLREYELVFGKDVETRVWQVTMRLVKDLGDILTGYLGALIGFCKMLAVMNPTTLHQQQQQQQTQQQADRAKKRREHVDMSQVMVERLLEAYRVRVEMALRFVTGSFHSTASSSHLGMMEVVDEPVPVPTSPTNGAGNRVSTTSVQSISSQQNQVPGLTVPTPAPAIHVTPASPAPAPSSPSSVPTYVLPPSSPTTVPKQERVRVLMESTRKNMVLVVVYMPHVMSGLDATQAVCLRQVKVAMAGSLGSSGGMASTGGGGLGKGLVSTGSMDYLNSSFGAPLSSMLSSSGTNNTATPSLGTASISRLFGELIDGLKSGVVDMICQGWQDVAAEFYQYEDWTVGDMWAEADFRRKILKAQAQKQAGGASKKEKEKDAPQLQAQVGSTMTSLSMGSGGSKEGSYSSAAPSAQIRVSGGVKLFYAFEKVMLRGLFQIMAMMDLEDAFQPNKPTSSSSEPSSAPSTSQKEREAAISRSVARFNKDMLERVKRGFCESLLAFLDSMHFMGFSDFPWGGVGDGDGSSAVGSGKDGSGAFNAGMVDSGIVSVQETGGSGTGGDGAVLDISNSDVRLLILLTNLHSLKTQTTPKLIHLFESLFGASLTVRERKEVFAVHARLDQKIWTRYCGSKISSATQIIDRGILFNGIDWSTYQIKPAHVQGYVDELLISLVLAYSEIQSVLGGGASGGLVQHQHAFGAVVRGVQTAFERAFSNVDGCSLNGAMQALIDLMALKAVLSPSPAGQSTIGTGTSTGTMGKQVVTATIVVSNEDGEVDGETQMRQELLKTWDRVAALVQSKLVEPGTKVDMQEVHKVVEKWKKGCEVVVMCFR